MGAHVGDRIVVETERVGMRDREGEILEVLDSPAGTHYRVRWDDGRETTFWPAAGSARIVTAVPAPAAAPAPPAPGSGTRRRAKQTAPR